MPLLLLAALSCCPALSNVFWQNITNNYYCGE